jgi:hypothetical protein
MIWLPLIYLSNWRAFRGVREDNAVARTYRNILPLIYKMCFFFDQSVIALIVFFVVLDLVSFAAWPKIALVWKRAKYKASSVRIR